MEVKLGVTYSPKVLWLADAKGRRVGVPTEKLAYVEVGEEHPDKRVGFSSP
jgi:hypothetical protein